MQASLGTRSRGVDALLWSLTAVSGGLTLWWSLGPVPAGVEAFSGADKAMHASAYFATSLLFFLAAVWRPGRGSGPLYAYRWFLVLLVILGGGVVEIAQSAFTDGREAEFLDWVAEIAAVLAAVGIVAILERRSALTRVA